MPHPRIDLLIKFLWKIKRIGNDDISKSSAGMKRPLKHIIEYLLVLRQQEINLINHYYLILPYSRDHVVQLLLVGYPSTRISIGGF